MRNARPRDYVGQGTGTGGCRRGMWARVSPFPGLRIVFIARPLSLTADFYSVSLHKSAYDILCAPARKIVTSRAPAPREYRAVLAIFLISIYRPAARSTRRPPLCLPRGHVVRSRESTVYASAHFFPCRRIFFSVAGAYLRDDDKSVTVAQFAEGNRHRAAHRVLHDNIYKLIFCVSFPIKYSCILAMEIKCGHSLLSFQYLFYNVCFAL